MAKAFTPAITTVFALLVLIVSIVLILAVYTDFFERVEGLANETFSIKAAQEYIDTGFFTGCAEIEEDITGSLTLFFNRDTRIAEGTSIYSGEQIRAIPAGSFPRDMSTTWYIKLCNCDGPVVHSRLRDWNRGFQSFGVNITVPETNQDTSINYCTCVDKNDNGVFEDLSGDDDEIGCASYNLIPEVEG